MNRSPRDRVLAAFLLSLSASLLSTAAILYIASQTLTFTTDFDKIRGIVSVPIDTFSPEPLERFLYLLGLVLLPGFSVAAYYAAGRRGERLLQWLTAGANRLYALFGGVALAACIVAGAGIVRDRYNLVDDILGAGPVTAGLAVALGGMFPVSLAVPERGACGTFIRKAGERIAESFALFLIACSVLVCVFDEYLVVEDGRFTSHFNSAFYAVVQVVFGKELLVDTFNMYGLYPHFIEPVFRLVPLSVASFTVLMGLLAGLSYAAMYLFIRKATTHRIIGMAGLVAAMYFGYFLGRILYQDPYFQYAPVRTLFPSLAMYLAWRYFTTGGRVVYHACFLLGSFSMLWNFDSGIVTFLSWLLALIFGDSGRRDAARRILGHLATAVVSGAGAFLLFNVYMGLRYGHVPDYSSFFVFQRLFYGYGFMMIPMKVLHPWNLVALAYAVGLLYGVACRFEGTMSPKAVMVVFLSVLGFGLFANFQGRSHNTNLLAVSYPAFLVVALLADSLADAVRRGNALYDKIVLGAFAAVLAFGVIGMAGRTVPLVRLIASRFETMTAKTPTPITRGAEFIRNSVGRDDNVLILSEHNGIYYLASGRPCPIDTPATSDFLLIDHYRKIDAYLRDPAPKKVFVDADFRNFHASLIFPALERGYRAVGLAPDGNIAMFVR